MICRVARHTGRGRRKGAVIIIVLFLLTIVGVVVGTLVHALLIEHRQLRVHHQQLQAAWLAESGLRRAVARLRTDGQFSGETWSLPAEALGSDADASVEIRVAPVEGRPHWRYGPLPNEFFPPLGCTPLEIRTTNPGKSWFSEPSP